MGTYTQTISDAANSCRWHRSSGGDFANDKIYSGQSATPYTYDSVLHFTGVNIPKGASVKSATLSVNIELYYGTPVLVVKGESADNPATVSSAADGVSRSRTTASVNPSFTGTGVKNINVLTIVQEIFSRAGWASGNSLNLFIDDNGSAADNFVRSLAVGTYARTLTIVYTVPSGGFFALLR